MTATPVATLQEAMEQRRAARAFRADPIPEATLQAILRLGTRAPSGFNLQPWRFILLREPSSKERLQPAAFNQRQLGEAPVVLICCGDRRALQSDNIEATIELGRSVGGLGDDQANYMRNSIPAFAENAPSFEHLEAWVNRHTMLAVAHLMVAAKGLGVDSYPMEGFSTPQVKAAFDIPAEVDVCCLLALGYAAEPFKPYGGRFALDRVCYSERYGEPLTL